MDTKNIFYLIKRKRNEEINSERSKTFRTKEERMKKKKRRRIKRLENLYDGQNDNENNYKNEA